MFNELITFFFKVFNFNNKSINLLSKLKTTIFFFFFLI